ncbi:MAG: hypothetical protein R3C49_21435 [Planctomycetaceae bacterium]
MQQLIDSLLTYLAGNWPELVWIVLVAGFASYAAGRRSQMQWRKRDFLHRLNVSLSSIDGGVLKIRTILEMDVEDIFLNRAASDRIAQLAQQTTEIDPLIPIPKDDLWFYLNSVLNEISERFALGHLQADAGRSVRAEKYLLCLTCEQAGAVRTRKIRAMLIREALLTNLPETEPSYESPTHATRWKTLQQMAKKRETFPECFLKMELSL